MSYNQNTVINEMYLPQFPQNVSKVEECTKLLTDRCKNCWEFLFEEIKDIPNIFAYNQDYDLSVIDEEKWQSVVVPSSLVMQGFDIQNNTEYYYKRTVKVSKDYKDKNVYLRFEGVYSNARVWINNEFCTSHIGSFTAWDIDITKYSQCDEITLVVGVADVEGKTKSPWNTSGEYQSNSAWMLTKLLVITIFLKRQTM